MIIAIADDITGAAEIAGVALRHGRSVTFSVNSISTDTHTDVNIVATDTRSVAPSEADDTCRHLCRTAMGLSPQPLLFKKVDSVLRGNVSEELSAILHVTPYNRVLLLPQNPTRGRTISGGIYYINNVELCKTAFADDPEFPARTSVVGQLLSSCPSVVSIADATTVGEICHLVAQAPGDTLVAGGADTFSAFLLAHPSPSAAHAEAPYTPNLSTENLTVPLLAIQGSTQSHSLIATPFFRHIGGRDITMPDDVFHGSSPRPWLCRLKEEWRNTPALALRIGTHEAMGAHYAIRLRQLMALATADLVGEKQPSSLIFEGGATAFAALSALGWEQFDAEGELAPGVVALRHGQTLVILKPGSYKWNME